MTTIQLPEGTPVVCDPPPQPEYIVLTLAAVQEPPPAVGGFLSGSTALYLKWRIGNSQEYFDPCDLAKRLNELAEGGWRIVAAPTHTHGSQIVLAREVKGKGSIVNAITLSDLLNELAEISGYLFDIRERMPSE